MCTVLNITNSVTPCMINSSKPNQTNTLYTKFAVAAKIFKLFNFNAMCSICPDIPASVRYRLDWEASTVPTALRQCMLGCIISFIVCQLLKYIGSVLVVILIIMELLRRSGIAWFEKNRAFNWLEAPVKWAVLNVTQLSENPVNRNFLAGLAMGGVVALREWSDYMPEGDGEKVDAFI